MLSVCPFFSSLDQGDISTKDLVIEHGRTSGWSIDTSVTQWAEDAGFHHLTDLRVQLLKHHTVRQFCAAVAEDCEKGSRRIG